MKRVEFPYEVKNGSVNVKIYRTPSRGCDSFTLSYWQDGRRKRPTFSDFGRAKKEAETVAKRLTSSESAVLKLTSADRAAYLRAQQLLKPTATPLEVAAADYGEARKILGDVPLRHAAEFYVKRHPKDLQVRLIKDLIKEMLIAKAKDGLSDVYINNLRYDLKKFATANSCTISAITGSDIDTWLRSLDVSPRTRNNLRTSVQTLFSFAKSRGYLPRDHDEMTSVSLAKASSGDIEIFSPAEMTELLSCAGPHLIPFLALGAFAGVRHAEIQRLDWDTVRLQDGIIEIRAANAKTASRRTIPISVNLKAWLLPHSKPSGLVCRHRNMADEIVDLVTEVNERRDKAEVSGRFAWKRNALRHSFISYRVAKTQNVAQVALEAGNSPQMIFRHYRELVRPVEAENWFGLTPQSCDKAERKN